MKHFTQWLVEEAVEHAAAGGQALHTHQIIVDRDKAPQCFKSAVDRGENIAHLFDQDINRLRRTVRELGVNVVVVERIGGAGQHVDLCGKPLARAMKMCERPQPLFDGVPN